ncbi:hypothetical protein U1Q18_008545 [Sarracenia purpurea var. burkii]
MTGAAAVDGVPATDPMLGLKKKSQWRSRGDDGRCRCSIHSLLSCPFHGARRRCSVRSELSYRSLLSPPIHGAWGRCSTWGLRCSVVLLDVEIDSVDLAALLS